MIGLPDTDTSDSYRMWADLRSFLQQLVKTENSMWQSKRLVLVSRLLFLTLDSDSEAFLLSPASVSDWVDLGFGSGNTVIT